MKPRIIFFDIDGTLVPLKEGIRPRTVEALQKLRQNGIRLCIATGRTPMEMPKFEGVTFDALLTYNGSYCFTPERDIFKNLIPKEDIVTLHWGGPLHWPRTAVWWPTAPNQTSKNILPSAG